MQARKIWTYLFLLTALGANTLIVELVIPRMIAPVFGNTLFSWTAIIAVVLLALAVGYRFGGLWATSNRVNRLIILFSVGAAFWGLALALFGDELVQMMRPLNLMFGPLLAAILLAALPAFLDAAVVPMVIQVIPGEPGGVSGRCFAWSTVGSIFGVLLTGYVLLPQLGIAGALATGVVLIILSLFFLRRMISVTFLLLLLIGTTVWTGQRQTNLLYDRSNGYHRIRITENSDVRTLMLDSTVEGLVRLGDERPVAIYASILTGLLRQHLVESTPAMQRAFFIGGGAFSISRYLKHIAPAAEIRVAEVDPDVVRVGRQLLELPDSIDVVIGDGRSVLTTDRSHYDLIVNDAFQGLRKNPFHLTTHEFNQLVYDRLSAHGIYVSNLRGDPAESYLASSFVKTLRQTFDHISTVRASHTNHWVIASKEKLNWAPEITVIGDMAQIFTDDHAPVEYLIVRDLVEEKLKRMTRG